MTSVLIPQDVSSCVTDDSNVEEAVINIDHDDDNPGGEVVSAIPGLIPQDVSSCVSGSGDSNVEALGCTRNEQVEQVKWSLNWFL